MNLENGYRLTDEEYQIVKAVAESRNTTIDVVVKDAVIGLAAEVMLKKSAIRAA